jgi:hypothetical protein
MPEARTGRRAAALRVTSPLPQQALGQAGETHEHEPRARRKPAGYRGRTHRSVRVRYVPGTRPEATAAGLRHSGDAGGCGEAWSGTGTGEPYNLVSRR